VFSSGKYPQFTRSFKNGLSARCSKWSYRRFKVVKTSPDVQENKSSGDNKKFDKQIV
jgi:hypothetical protein